MRDNPLQFAIVREDPNTVVEAIERFTPSKALLIASGGCSCLTLRQVRPDLAITLFDPNPAQLEHVQEKLEALQSPSQTSLKALFNVGDDSPRCLNQSGNFASPFRRLRHFLCEFVMSPREWRELFEGELGAVVLAGRVFGNPYWKTAEAAGYSPYASVTVLEHRMKNWDWSFVLTSDIREVVGFLREVE
jgi:S-adenosylmethionine-diacylglycerol 3-amino-3-carboxypropyl transferase